MIQVKIKVPDPKSISDKIKRNLITDGFLNQIQSEIVENEIKKSISVGLSPVRSFRRFVAYKNKENYPGDLKPSRPVNLYLSGKMLKQYVAEKSGQLSFYLGISKNAPSDIKVYALANNEGTKDIPERRFVPIRGETFNVTIMRKLKDMISKRVAHILNKK